MPLNPDAVGARGEPSRHSWTSKDALLYAVGVGAGLDELQYTTESTQDMPQKVLPTFAVILGGGGVPLDQAGTYNKAMMVHALQGIELFGEIPTEGEIASVGEITGIWDKGSAGVVAFSSESKDLNTGEVLLRTHSALFCRGEGGWGGDRGPNDKVRFPEREPDHQKTYQTREDQALTYRLSGDRNPLHTAPAFASQGGFDKPILHGLCTYGFTGRALLNEICGGDGSKFKSMHARFSKPVLPGDTLKVSMWTDGNEALFRTTNQNDQVVMDQGRFTFA